MSRGSLVPLLTELLTNGRLEPGRSGVLRVERLCFPLIAVLLATSGLVAAGLAAADGQPSGRQASGAKPQPAAAVAKPPATASEAAGATEDAAEESPAATPTAETQPLEDREALNLAGQTDSSSGESRRNENVQFNAVDNNALRELNTRLGTTATIVQEFEPGRRYFGTEFGGSATRPIHPPGRTAAGVHGSLDAAHNNSIFSARSFFQVGAVKPARENDAGFTLSAPVWRGGSLFLEGSRQAIRGSVNGNVLVPRPDERTPIFNHPDTRVNDPATLAAVQQILGAYPNEAPNRTDINPRALNTNAPQRIDTDVGGIQLDQEFGALDRLITRYRFTSQQVDAFQLVTGQNPDTTIRNHSARLGWTRTWSPRTVMDLSAGFDRVGSLLTPEENAIPRDVSFGDAIERLGPGSEIPLDRAQNQFLYGARVRHVRGPHNLTAGFELLRRQFNGIETSSRRGVMGFRNDFGRDAITNLRLGIPSRFSGALGESHMGFRNWDTQYFVGDEWRAKPNLTLSMGLRYSPVTRPTEVSGRVDVGFPCDCNNVGGHFGFAYELPRQWGVVRAGYGLHYAEVYPATYHQVRFNPPAVFKISNDAPDLVDPLEGRRFEDLDPNDRATSFRNDPRLVSPYAQQYNFSWEPLPGRVWRLQLGYVGSRSQKLFMKWYTNRAVDVPGTTPTSGNINDRRPDQNFFDIRKIINSSRGYFDAARASLVLRDWNGVTVDASYWFSKAIDLGAGYTDTGAGASSLRSRNQSEFLIHEDLRGLSSFDQTHAFLWSMNYLTPAFGAQGRLARNVLGQWNLSTVVLLKTGTPFTILSGSDSPGFGNLDGSSGDRPHVVDPAVLGRSVSHPDTSASLLPTTAFAFMRVGDTRGNVGRNTFRKDGIRNVNAALSRTWNVRADKSFTFRAESINFFNVPQFAEPGRTLAAADFGQITNTLNDGRTFRFLLRFAF